MKKNILIALSVLSLTLVKAQEIPRVKELLADLQRCSYVYDATGNDSTNMSKDRSQIPKALLLTVFFRTENLTSSHRLLISIGKEPDSEQIMKEKLNIIEQTIDGNRIYALVPIGAQKEKGYIIKGGVSINYSLAGDIWLDVRYISVCVLDSKNIELSKTSYKIK